MTRRIRSLAAVAALAAVVFSQLAVAAYACPGADGMASSAAAVADGLPDCHKAPATDELAALCQAHCQQGDQSVDRMAAPLLAAVPSQPFTARLEGAIVAEPAVALRSLLARPTGPPAVVRHCRFLI